MKRAEELLEKYNLGTVTSEERALVETWYNKQKPILPSLNSAELEEEHLLGRQRLQDALKKQQVRRIWKSISFAASLLLFVGLAWFLYSTSSSSEEEVVLANLLPDKNTAILTLENGQQITLSEGYGGEISHQEGVLIKQTVDGEVVYVSNDDNTSSNTPSYHTIETPVGNQFKVVLPDGSRVYLSSSSKLRYPVRFSSDRREVELTGQAHFEIVPAYIKSKTEKTSSRERASFIVKARNQEVEVLGTEFSITAYDDDEFVETALLEGSVRVAVDGATTGLVLKPGQMAVNDVRSSKMEIKEFDLLNIKAWQEGYFIFDNENIKDIMKKLARWYGFQVEYVGSMGGMAFQGNYSRTRDIKQLLKTMELGKNLEFQVIDKNKERRIVVKRKN